MNATHPTIVLIHGLWVTPECWDHFRQRYEDRGFEVWAPPWPGISGDAGEMRRDSSGLAGVGAGEVVEHYAKIIRSLPEPPIIMGHSYGGVITQVLINKGLGSAGVAIDSVPPKGILVLPVSTYLALLPAFLNPLTFWGTFLFSFKQFWRVFANTLSEAEAQVAYKSAIPASGRAIYQASLANFMSNAPTQIDFAKSDRAPLLMIGGEKDVIMPSALNRKNFRKYQTSKAITEFKEFKGRSHYIIAESGWEEVADFALQWALEKGEKTSLK